MSQHQLHMGQTTVSDIPLNDSVHNLLADQGATVYGNSAATSKLNIFVAIIDTIKATGGRWSKLCLRGNERVKPGDALSTLHNDGAYQGHPWHFLLNIGCTAIDLLCADGAGGFVKHMLMPGAFLTSSKVTGDWETMEDTKAWETMEERGTGFAGYKQQQRLRMCMCGKCRKCRLRAYKAKSRAKEAAAKAVVEVVDLTED
ncbi:hypothetical protein HYH03_001374 [Edaphochlamys debaryana]|uniref:Uncharacterized protein n=1 Tax=Edaphochlamys debaryana TaxID=47281 RepID=A0A836C4W6_9CHLO|nr:hypothetical protein HYH03_001374 [Edaphochlamys debaryana]|eukprot:KAG2500606.1 hypothetical protein HYH03_001374 [Edaphochlamys debaryana]